MKKIDIQRLKKYLKREGDNTLARVGHVNSVVTKIAQISENVYANNAAALAAGLQPGDFYSTATGEVRVVI